MLSGFFDAYADSDDDYDDEPDSPQFDLPPSRSRPNENSGQLPLLRGSTSPVSPQPMADQRPSFPLEQAKIRPVARKLLQETEVIDLDADSPRASSPSTHAEAVDPKQPPTMLGPGDPEFSLEIPRVTAPEKPKTTAKATALFSSPEGSDFDMEENEAEGPMLELCPNVKHSLSMLPLQNVGLYVPQFLEYEPPTPNDLAVLHALEDILEAEKSRRAQDVYAVSNPPRSILVVAADHRRAIVWEDLITQNSRLSVAAHGIERQGHRGRNRHRDGQALDSVFELKDAIITVGYRAHGDAEHNFLYLRRVAVLVFDVDFNKVSDHEPSISERAHPCAMLMRDFYRALPPTHRPRVLAITGRKLFPVEVPPIEHNLFCRFLSTNVKEEAEWRSCYGQGSRTIESSMMDVENLYYRVESVTDGSDMTARGSRRRPAVKAKRDRTKLSELEYLLEQVGQLGVALYQRRWRQRYAGKRAGLPKPKESVNSSFPLSCDVPLVGLSEKVLHLLNELQRAYAASTRESQLRAIIHAGRPTVACALGEIIRVTPVFQGLEVRIVLGCDAGKSFESYSPDDDGKKTTWQGDETDDEAVSSFAGGDANILIVARPFCTRSQRNRPLPPCPFVLRFDDSVADPSMDGGGGRCRVVQFKETVKNRFSRAYPSEKQQRSSDPETDTVEPHCAKTIVEQDGSKPGGDVKTKTQQVLARSDSDEDKADNEKMDVDRPPPPEAPMSSDIDEDVDDNSHYYYCRPPRALLGPDDETTTCFLYRALVFEAIPGHASPPVGAKARKVGVEDFVLVFSEQLDERDRTVLLPDTSARAGNNNGIAAYMKLDYQGRVSLSNDQLQQGRQYTAAIFSLASPSFSAKGFHWEGFHSTNLKIPHTSPEEKKGTDATFLRRYLILPVEETDKLRREDSTEVPDLTGVPSDADKKLVTRRLLNKYFQGGTQPLSVKWPEYACKVDWDAVCDLLDSIDSRSGSEQLSNALLPEQYSRLEGKLVKSRFPGERAALCGRLQPDLCPLSKHIRSKKFVLNGDGTLALQEDLSNLIQVVASEETVAQQAAVPAVRQESERKTNSAPVSSPTNKRQDISRIASKKGPHPNGIDVSPVKWCELEKRLVFDGRMVGRKRKHSEVSPTLFDADRNVSKKRKTWVGHVYYSYEEYYKKHYPSGIKFLEQPMLAGAKPSSANYHQFLEAVRDTSIPEVCDELVEKGQNKRMLIPELCHLYPVSTGVIFLPAALFHLEKHLSVCELRKKFDSKIGVNGDLEELRQCVTADHVNKSRNYERLEFLGDSILKLSCTKRLFARRPHDSEGQMHNARAFRVSNERLHRLGHRLGLHHYLQFRADTVEEWRPPGTDIKGKVQKASVKALADVVEALCGAYFLFGVKVTSEDEIDQEAKQGQAPETNLLEFYADGETSAGSSSESDGMDGEDGGIDVDDVGGGKGKTTRKRKDSASGRHGNGIRPFTATEVERGYIAGYKFLEECQVFEDEEPTHTELLLSAIHAMHPQGSRAPHEVSFEAFPQDRRLTNPRMPWEEEFGPLEKKLRYKFKRRPLLTCALTHNSYVISNGRNTTEQQTFQRLEYFGDAVADFCVAVYLYHRYPALGPGELTNLKSNVVSNEAFARLTVQMGLHKYLFHGSTAFTAEISNFIKAVKGEKEEGHGELGGLKRTLGEIAAPKVLGDIFESVIGAIYVDSGLQTAWRVCMHLLSDSLRINADPRRDDTHPTQELQELVTRSWKLSMFSPRYDLEPVPAGMRGKKCMAVYILGEKIATGFGTTVKRAKLKAAIAALVLLKDDDPNSAGAAVLRRLKEESIKRQVEKRNTYR